MLNNTLIRMLLCQTIQDTRRRVPPYEKVWWMQMSLSEVLDGEVDSRSRSTRATGDTSNRWRQEPPEIRICWECLPFLFTTVTTTSPFSPHFMSTSLSSSSSTSSSSSSMSSIKLSSSKLSSSLSYQKSSSTGSCSSSLLPASAPP